MAISKRLRFEILRRDNHACKYCGAQAPGASLTVDHVVPLSLGGTDLPSNLVTACRDCNAGKSSIPADAEVVDDVKAQQLRWGQALRMAAENVEARHEEAAEAFEGFKAVWLRSTYQSNGIRYYLNGGLPADWVDTLQDFHRRGLPISEIESAANIIDGLTWVPRDHWTYCLGILNNKLRAIQQEAQRIMENEE